MKSLDDEICKRILKMDNDRMDRMINAILEIKDSDELLFLKFNRSIKNEPIVVNNGDVFGQGSNWFTFFCPKCSIQINPRQQKCKCGQWIHWKEKHENEK